MKSEICMSHEQLYDEGRSHLVIESYFDITTSTLKKTIRRYFQ